MANKIDELLEMARSAKDSDDKDNAKNCYEKILDADPSNAEALFYTKYYQVWSSKVIDTPKAFSNFSSGLSTVVYAVKKKIKDKDEIVSALTEYFEAFKKMPAQLHRSIVSNSLVSRQARDHFCQAGINCYYGFGDAIEKQFSDDEILKIAVESWKCGAQQQVNWKAVSMPKGSLENYISKIQKFDPSYKKPKMNAGCITIGTK